MILIPVIWIKDGECSDVRMGADNNSTSLFNDPIRLARLWRIQNAKALLLDFQDCPAPQKGLEIVSEICSSVMIPVMLSLPERLGPMAAELITKGVSRIVIDRQCGGEEPGSTLKELQAKRKIAFRYQLEDSAEYRRKLVSELKGQKSNRIFIKQSQASPNILKATLDLLRQEGHRNRITLDVPIYSHEEFHLWDDCQKLGLDSLLLPKEIYSNIFPCQKLWCWNEPGEVDISEVSTASLRKKNKATSSQS